MVGTKTQRKKSKKVAKAKSHDRNRCQACRAHYIIGHFLRKINDTKLTNSVTNIRLKMNRYPEATLNFLNFVMGSEDFRNIKSKCSTKIIVYYLKVINKHILHRKSLKNDARNFLNFLQKVKDSKSKSTDI